MNSDGDEDMDWSRDDPTDGTLEEEEEEDEESEAEEPDVDPFALRRRFSSSSCASRSSR